MKNLKALLKKKHSKKEHDAHLNDERKLNEASVRQEERGLTKNGTFCGKKWFPQGPHKKNRA